MGLQSKSEPIDPAIAQAMVTAYAKDGLTLTAPTPQCYTKAVWFPAEQIINFAKAMSEGKYDGLRIYFAQYTNSAGELEGLPQAHYGKNTMLLVPTIPGLGGTGCNGEGDGDDHQDDLENIENRGNMCPDMCDGTLL